MKRSVFLCEKIPIANFRSQGINHCRPERICHRIQCWFQIRKPDFPFDWVLMIELGDWAGLPWQSVSWRAFYPPYSTVMNLPAHHRGCPIPLTGHRWSPILCNCTKLVPWKVHVVDTTDPNPLLCPLDSCSSSVVHKLSSASCYNCLWHLCSCHMQSSNTLDDLN